MKSITYRRRFCVHLFGRRTRRISRLTALLLSSVMANGWSPGVSAQYVVSAGQTTSGVIVPAGVDQTQWVFSGGTAIATVVNSAGTQVVSGGTAIGTLVSDGGTQTVVDSGTASSTTILTGLQYIADGGTATDTVVNGLSAVPVAAQIAGFTLAAIAGAGPFTISATPSAPDGVTIVVSSGGTVQSATLDSALQFVDSGGTATSNIIIAGVQLVNSGGTALDTVLLGGVQLVNGSGSTATSNLLVGSVQVVGNGGSTMNNVLVGSVQALELGGSATSNSLTGSYQLIGYDSIATSNTLELSAQDIGYGGNAVDTTLDRSVQTVGSGGTATSTSVDYASVQYVLGGHALDTEVNSSGTQMIAHGGIASSNNINDGGTQYVASAGSAVDTVVSSGGYQYVVGGTATGNVVDGGTQSIASGGVATSNRIEDGGAQYVASAGSAFDTVVSSGGYQYVVGGSATGNSIEDGGTQYVASAGTARYTTVNSGGKEYVLGGLASSSTLLSGGMQYVASGGVADVTMVGNGATQYVAMSGTANASLLSGGTQIVGAGGVATSTSVNSGGLQYVASAGVASATLINSGGAQNVVSGGTAIGTTVNTGGVQYLTNGAVVTDTTLDGGTQSVNAGSLANTTTVNTGGLQAVNSGALTSGTVINNGGSQIVMGGGVTSSSVVNSGGRQNVLGTVVSATVNSGGTLMIGQGGTSGRLAGDTQDNGTLVFDLAGTYTYGGTLTGSGTLVNAHSGTVVLNGASSAYSGTTRVLAGTLEVGDSTHSSATLGGDVVVGEAGTLRGHGTIGGNVVNDGVVSPGGSIGTTTIAGNYQQSSGATLQVEISPTSASQLDVMGNATLAGTLAIVYDAGSSVASSTYAPGTVTLLKAASITGTFAGEPAAIVESGANLSYVVPSVAYKANEVDLILTPVDTSIYTAMGSAISQVAQATNAAILDRASRLCRTSNASDCIAGTDHVWIKAIGDYARTDNNGGISGYSARQYGFIAGYDHRIGRYDVGGTLAYSHVDVSEAQTPDTGTADSLRWSAYGGMWTGPVNLAATVGLGYDFIDQKRPFDTATGTATGSHNGLEATAAAQASMPLPSLGGFVLIPRAGLRFAYFHGDAFSESGAGAQNLIVGTDNIQSVQPYAQLALRYAFGSTEMPSHLEAYVGYAREVGTTNRAVSVSAQDGTLFTASGVPLPRNLVTAGVSLNMRMTRSLWVSAAFDTLLHTSNASIKAGSIKVDYRF
ncbi:MULTISPECIES: autotransporter domain-containing protein [unclassified Paraburkholderia]|uniref:autotransporter domain-containing protein n=1 Tax=unclassified Paraburkholderia TaxID=2615204 RepID=UPI002AB0A90E|nr:MULTISPECIES: autotransporter domain-containing protein [unclassified Paraburkholderia]